MRKKKKEKNRDKNDVKEQHLPELILLSTFEEPRRPEKYECSLKHIAMN